MEQQANGSLRLVMSGLALAIGVTFGTAVFAQRAAEGDAPPPTNIDVATGKILNEAIELKRPAYSRNSR